LNCGAGRLGERSKVAHHIEGEGKLNESHKLKGETFPVFGGGEEQRKEGFRGSDQGKRASLFCPKKDDPKETRGSGRGTAGPAVDVRVRRMEKRGK